MLNKKKTTSIVVVLIMVFISVIIFDKIYNKPHLNVSEAATEITTTSAALIKDYELDEEASNAKYLDKVILVKGVISKIITDKNKTIITLGKGAMLGNVVCHLSLEQNKKASALLEGQSITIKGICTGYLMDVILVKAVLIN